MNSNDKKETVGKPRLELVFDVNMSDDDTKKLYDKFNERHKGSPDAAIRGVKIGDYCPDWIIFDEVASWT